jgi:hypothetical protein
VSQAAKILGTESLPGLPHLDVKTAQMLGAGMAARRLMDSKAMAALLVSPEARSQAPRQRQGATAVDRSSPTTTANTHGRIVPIRPSQAPEDPELHT